MTDKVLGYIVLLFIILSANLVSQIDDNSRNNKYSLTNERYFTDQNGNILMNVNIWGHVKHPGNYSVQDGIDFAMLLSLSGGPLPGAKLNKILLYRAIEDEDGEIKYTINLNKFYKTGERSEFVKIMPNDTIIIKETALSQILRNTNVITSILQLINIGIAVSLIG